MEIFPVNGDIAVHTIMVQHHIMLWKEGEKIRLHSYSVSSVKAGREREEEKNNTFCFLHMFSVLSGYRVLEFNRNLL